MHHLLDQCPLTEYGLCQILGQRVNPLFCQTECNGKNAAIWKERLSANRKDAIECSTCQWYHPCGQFCRLLTRATNLNKWFAAGKPCPLKKQSSVSLETDKPVTVFPQPARHPARWKKIFTRADGSMVDLIDLFRGQSAFLCCGGPSFAAVDKSQLALPGILTMAVNNTAHLFRPNLWTAQDPPYRFMWTIWEDPRIMKFTLWDYRRDRYWLPRENRFSDRTLEQCPNLFFHKRKSDLVAASWLDEDRIVWGTPKVLQDGSNGARSVFLAALHILYFLGFHKVYLLGVDFHMDEKNGYWFDEYRSPAAIRNNQRVYEQTAEHCKALRPYLEKAGFNVFNCNPDSRLKVFDYYPFKKAIAENTIDLSDSTRGMYVKRK
ncbi:MAG TPA: hypothetical protein PK052_06880 [Anaerohalosphaeraceae bacterium]|nr:hypothetical protein [Anaerohalosphaeraceae bacterium]HOL31691.1 hypothetical protein [Anaerohalosphaeraceae bacterium]